MTIEQVVTDYLETVISVRNIVATRIYQLKLRQGTPFPALRVQLIDDDREYHLRGVLNLKRARVQIDSYNTEGGTDPYAAISALAEAIELAMGGVRFTVNDVRVVGAFQVLRRALHEPGAIPLIRVQQDFRFRYKRVS